MKRSRTSNRQSAAIRLSRRRYANLALCYARTNRGSEAVATAQKALELARLQHKTGLVTQLEAWLKTNNGK